MEALFTKDKHQYTLDGSEGISVSAYTGQFKEPFDEIFISTRSVIKDEDYPKYAQLLKENGYDEEIVVKQLSKDIENLEDKALAIRKSWRAKAEKGTIFHDKKERHYLGQGFKISPFDGERYDIPDCVYEKNAREDCDNATPVDDLSKLPPGYYPELVLYDEEELVLGQADEVYIKQTPTGKIFDIDDYKTDKSIWEKSMFDRKNKGFKMLLFPLDHLMDTNKNYYGVKINKYADMLIRKGFKKRNLSFTHIDLNNSSQKEVRYMLPDMSKEIALLRKYYDKKK